MNNEKYIRHIATIIILTIIPAILCLPWFWERALSFILGTLASLINFLWLAKNIRKSLQYQITKTKLTAVKGSFLRMAFLIIYSSVLLFLIKPDIILFGLGLLSTQIVIYLNEFYNLIKSSKYFQG